MPEDAEQPTTPDQVPAEFSWTVCPARERIGRAVLGTVIVLVLAALVWQMMQSWWWGLVALAVLVAALNRFFFTSRFSIDDEGITARYPLRVQRLAWSDLRRFSHDREGGHLSTRGRQSFLDAFRGMTVFFGRDPDTVIRQIRAHLPAQSRPGGRQWAH